MKRTINRSERNKTRPAFFHPYLPSGMVRRDCRGDAEVNMETGGGLLRPLDMNCRCTQGFQVRNDLRITE